jgi:ABC-2 type transport system ATP-binding protein
MSLLRCDGVYKLYGEKPALQDVSFTLEEGEIVGLLGLNGAGKSTLMKLISGMAPPSKGSIQLGGYNVETEHVKAAQLVGAMIESPAFHMELTGWQNLKLLGLIRPSVTPKSMFDAVETVGLDESVGYAVKKFSIGMKQRLHFAQALMGDSRLLLLDEPLSGIDPIAAKKIRDAILAYASKGGAVIVSSHVLAEIEHFCSRIIIIDHGQIVLDRMRKEIENLEAVFIDVVSKGGKAQ